MRPFLAPLLLLGYLALAALGVPDDCRHTLIEDLPPPIFHPAKLTQKSPLKFAFVGFTPRGPPLSKAVGYPIGSAIRVPIMLGEAMTSYLQEPAVFYPSCDFDFGGYDVIITRGCKCVTTIRKTNGEALIGVASPHFMLDGEGLAPHTCAPKVDFVIAETGAMVQRFTGNDVQAVQLRPVENPPVDGTGAPLLADVQATFTAEAPAKICYVGDFQNFDTIRRKLFDNITKRRFGVPFEVFLFMDKNIKTNVMKTMPKPAFKVRVLSYSPDALPTVMQECTIGLVSGIFRDQDDEEKEECAGDNCQAQDLQWRYHVSANAAHAFTFMQLGIPVVAEAVPEVAETVGASKLGISLEDPKPAAWTWAVKQLLGDYCLRAFYAERSRAYADANLSPLAEAQRLLLYVSKMRKELKRVPPSVKRPDALTGLQAIAHYTAEWEKSNPVDASKPEDPSDHETAAATPDDKDATEIQPFGKSVTEVPKVPKEEGLPEGARMPEAGGQAGDEDPEVDIETADP